MRNDVPCDPPPGVEAVTGFAFQRDVDGVVVARCVVCRVGYVVSGNGEAATHATKVDRDSVHCGC